MVGEAYTYSTRGPELSLCTRLWAGRGVSFDPGTLVIPIQLLPEILSQVRKVAELGRETET